ncbi:LpxL/LpxP family acyltransferase [Rubrivivax rivuli]|uniref:Lipid A biosynthesis acyltransferase n=1 Tax=Rubrivivax rivuli TaxID=1862385 RepID=A0A437RM62_9BURK|nr:lipid A biosynthesis acyltransferase [Rubrivivax rivuli]RVU47665.1 lipid A biosynthesis acyltransferase [Rubrivivax rivuli]
MSAPGFKQAAANGAARLALGLVWLLHWLPLPVLARVGQGLGLLLHSLGRARREVARRNIALCMPQLSVAEQHRLVREHFMWTGRSLLERGLLWHASAERLKRLIHVEGEVHLAERSDRPVMWLVPHFVGLEVAGAATQLFQSCMGCDIYTAQSNPVMDAAFHKGRARFGLALLFNRQQGAMPVVRAIKKGAAFFNASDMDFGLRDAAFVPFYGQPAATLLAPSRMAKSLGMLVQPLIAEMLPGGQGYRVKFMPAWEGWPSDDPEADAAAMNRFIEQQIATMPAQYFWVHKRFKTRPPGEPPVY